MTGVVISRYITHISGITDLAAAHRGVDHREVGNGNCLSGGSLHHAASVDFLQCDVSSSLTVVERLPTNRGSSSTSDQVRQCSPWRKRSRYVTGGETGSRIMAPYAPSLCMMNDFSTATNWSSKHVFWRVIYLGVRKAAAHKRSRRVLCRFQRWSRYQSDHPSSPDGLRLRRSLCAMRWRVWWQQYPAQPGSAASVMRSRCGNRHLVSAWLINAGQPQANVTSISDRPDTSISRRNAILMRLTKCAATFAATPALNRLFHAARLMANINHRMPIDWQRLNCRRKCNDDRRETMRALCDSNLVQIQPIDTAAAISPDARLSTTSYISAASPHPFDMIINRHDLPARRSQASVKTMTRRRRSVDRSFLLRGSWVKWRNMEAGPPASPGAG